MRKYKKTKIVITWTIITEITSPYFDKKSRSLINVSRLASYDVQAKMRRVNYHKTLSMHQPGDFAQALQRKNLYFASFGSVVPSRTPRLIEKRRWRQFCICMRLVTAFVLIEWRPQEESKESAKTNKFTYKLPDLAHDSL
jgi:hypothetical protein